MMPDFDLGETPNPQLDKAVYRGLSHNGVKNYSKGPCMTFLE